MSCGHTIVLIVGVRSPSFFFRLVLLYLASEYSVNVLNLLTRARRSLRGRRILSRGCWPFRTRYILMTSSQSLGRLIQWFAYLARKGRHGSKSDAKARSKLLRVRILCTFFAHVHPGTCFAVIEPIKATLKPHQNSHNTPVRPHDLPDVLTEVDT